MVPLVERLNLSQSPLANQSEHAIHRAQVNEQNKSHRDPSNSLFHFNFIFRTIKPPSRPVPCKKKKLGEELVCGRVARFQAI